MALIDIDDRDTIHNYYRVKEDHIADVPALINIYKDWLLRLKAELPASCIVNHLGSGRYKIDLPTITCTGADVTTIFNIPFMHQINKMEMKHTDSANADSSNLLDYAVSHRHHPNLWLLLLDIVGSPASDIIDEYIDYYMGRGEYRIVTNSNITELLHVSVYIKIIGD